MGIVDLRAGHECVGSIIIIIMQGPRSDEQAAMLSLLLCAALQTKGSHNQALKSDPYLGGKLPPPAVKHLDAVCSAVDLKLHICGNLSCQVTQKAVQDVWAVVHHALDGLVQRA